MQYYVAGKIGGKAGSGEAGAAQRPLGDTAGGIAGPGHTHSLQLQNHLRPFGAEHFYGILIAQVIASLYCIKNMGLDAVAFPHNGVKASLRRPAVGAGGVDLAQYRHTGLFGSRQGRHQTGQTAAHYQHLVD
ncbi:MAG: hypothetical protein BWY65_02086 [Firmicutes bacterium ADurb.Bin373]|nr:MAG: hypothetical protein BWY65_02086 [Firmicutes bacterium ADurb.Bin373]